MQQSISNSETKKIMLSSKTREKSRSEWIFEQSIKSEETKKSYLRVLKKYKEFVGVENTEELLNADRKMIQEKVEDFVISMKGNINPNSFPTQLASIFLFYDLSDIVLNKTRIRKLYPAKIKKMGREAYSREDIRFLLENTNKKRSKAIILIFTSTGIKDIVNVPPYSIKTPDQKLVDALKIITEHNGKLTKKEMANLAEQQNLITINAQEKNHSMARFASLDKNIIQPLEEWKFIEIEQIGRNRWIKITEEGKNASEFLI